MSNPGHEPRSDKLRLVREGEEPAQDGPADANRQLPTLRSDHRCAIDINEATLEYPLGPYNRGSLKSSLFSLFGGKREARSAATHVEAVRNLTVSFVRGERVALIGRNGSGKSTLLRALAGIYPLKSGTIRVVGQIGTLLDIGLGFETESTGRENIYYRGMAMGISPRKLARLEQEIVEFTQLGDFIDLPIRTYSAGMQVRLGFGVSTQITPDVLLIDEVFGAGDAAFAANAARRIHDIIARAGIMVIATHDMSLVESLCTRCIWLNQGVVVRDGPPSLVTAEYQRYSRGEITF